MSDEHRTSGYEEHDIGLGAALWFAGGFVAVTALLILALTVIGGSLWRPVPEHGPDYRIGPMVAEGPRLQAAPERELHELRLRAAARLESYGWIDRSAGIAHIPIEAAMELTAERAREGAER